MDPTPASDRPTDQLRDLVAGIFRHPPGAERLGDATPGEIADAVLAALPVPALAVARQLLGTTTGAGPAAVPSTAAMLATPCDACDHTLNWHRNDVGCTVPRCVCGRFQDPVEATAPPAPADRAAVLREAAEVAVRAARACGESETGQYAASVAAGIGRDLRRLADDAAAGVQPPTTTSEADTEVQQGAVVQAIRDFQFDNYGLDTVDPNSEYAEWVGDLASAIVGALPAAPAAPEEPTR
ncbi:hypothetical protein [Streptomyces anulatus]|uniref:hypothetical protein n=1 Tax=Streptomyces anulatus TaxID=1892 RepID=UPI002ED039D2|nr:hypothetical protein OG703_33570 [Streptomyces anulatus]